MVIALITSRAGRKIQALSDSMHFKVGLICLSTCQSFYLVIYLFICLFWLYIYTHKIKALIKPSV